MGKTYRQARLNAQAQQREFLRTYREDDCPTLACALKKHGLNNGTYQRWRSEYARFRNEVDKAKAVKADARALAQSKAKEGSVLDIGRPYPPVPPLIQFRWENFGLPTPRHQEPIAAAYEDKTNLRIIVLGPPGSGKDTVARDIAAHASVSDRSTRVAWIMKNEKFSKRRIAQRLDPYLTDKAVYRTAPDAPGGQVPTHNLIDQWGPFRWEAGMKWSDGSKVEKTTWNTSEMYFIRRGAVEADPNLWATGIDGSLYGARVDLMVVSDPFDREDKRSPTIREQRLDWFLGTARSRLDERGRIIVLGTHVYAGDPYDSLIEAYVGDARVVSQDGYYTKYANGTATVIFPAIQYDENGEEVSYWPERFPLYGSIEVPGKEPTILTPEYVAGLSDSELRELTEQPGAKRVQGLLEIRESSPSLFDTMYQQQPPSDAEGEFTDMVLDHCDDPSRSFGIYRPGETLVLGVDPARTGGAAWFLWGVDTSTGVATLVDFFYGERLGLQGIRNQLLMEPLRQYMPRYLVFEVNRESAVLELPDIMDAVRATATDVVRHKTLQQNRNEGEASVASMVFDMRDGLIRFPAATAADRDRLRIVKDQFKTWDLREAAKSEGRSTWKSIGADDVVMAAWVGWFHVKQSVLKKQHNWRSGVRRIADITKRRWAARMPRVEGRDGPPSLPATDLVGEWYGGER